VNDNGGMWRPRTRLEAAFCDLILTV